MRVIVCQIQPFSNDQMIYVLEDNKQYYAQKVDIGDFPQTICAVAKEYKATKITLGGITAFNNTLADEIMTTYSLNYGQNDLEIEVL